jgi:hypothetical protein
VNYVAIVGRVYPASNEDYMRLVVLAWDFRRAVQVATRMIARGLEEDAFSESLGGC